MRSLYGLDNLVAPTLKKNIATKEVIDGLRELANDLEKYGNIDVFLITIKNRGLNSFLYIFILLKN